MRSNCRLVTTFGRSRSAAPASGRRRKGRSRGPGSPRPSIQLHGLVRVGIVDGLGRAGLGADAAGLHPALGLAEVHAVGAVDDRGVGAAPAGRGCRSWGRCRRLWSNSDICSTGASRTRSSGGWSGGAHRLAGPAGQTHLAAAVVGVSTLMSAPRPTKSATPGPMRSRQMRTHSPHRMQSSFSSGKRGFFDPVPAGQLADGLHLGAAGQEQLQAHPPAPAHPLRVGLDGEALADLVVAGGHQALALALGDLHHAEPAAAVGLQGGVVAEVGISTPLALAASRMVWPSQPDLGAVQRDVDVLGSSCDLLLDPGLLDGPVAAGFEAGAALGALGQSIVWSPSFSPLIARPGSASCTPGRRAGFAGDHRTGTGACRPRRRQ